MITKLKERVDWKGYHEIELNIVWCFMNLATDREEFGRVLLANGALDLLVFSPLDGLIA
jgi:importin subunit alpha-6/7